MANSLPKISLSAASLPQLHLEPFLRGDTGADEWFMPLGDPSETPLRGLGADTVRAAAAASALPCHLHVPVCGGSAVLEALAGLGCARVTLQLEGCPHPHRALGRLRDLGVSPGIAMLPCTPLTKADYLLPLVDRVVLLSAEPGGGAAAAGPVTERVKLLGEYLRYQELRAGIIVHGCADVALMGRAARLGAQGVVVEDLLPPDARDTTPESCRVHLDQFRGALSTAIRIA
ncbi:MAG: hypothetical protein GXY15_03295 [Candidatus Hydrogenedentes bacterium]|nr:hypothetical protein [Candidatus Hydrogenedentota bacterium]